MSDLTIQWIVVGAVVALCVWRAVGSVMARRRKGGGGWGCGGGDTSGHDCSKEAGCGGCPVARNCRKEGPLKIVKNVNKWLLGLLKGVCAAFVGFFTWSFGRFVR